MSLVNDMLRDLDRRRRLPVGGSAGQVALDSDGEYTGRSKLVLISAAAVIAAVVVGGVMYLGVDVPQSAPSATVATQESPLVERSIGSTATPGVGVTAVPGITARIAGERNRTNGFELRLESSEKASFEVLTRTDNSVTVLLPGVTTLSNQITSLDNIETAIVADGLLVSVNLDRDADFVVYDNSNAFTFAVAIEGYWKTPPEAEQSPQAADMTQMEAVVAEPLAMPQETPQQPVLRTESTRADTQPSAPVRTQRELSLQDRDRNATQQALRQVQSGQMQTAYSTLQDFITRNPEAHQSRNTLITLLYAQQQYEQVGLLVDDGLSLAPNLSSYKKMKARLLMMQGRHHDAVSLLRNVPPAVADDKEYFELLASLYQQTGDFSAAIATYQDLIRTDSNVGRWWAGMGISHESLGNSREAMSSFEVALQTPGLESNLRQYSRNRIKSLSGN